MSTEKLKLEVLLAAIDKATRPFKAITGGASETAKALKAAKDRLKELNDQQKRIDAFRKTDKDLSIVRNGLKGAQERIKALKEEIAKVPAPTKDMTRALKEATAEAGNYKGRLTTLLEKQQRLRTELNGAGLDTTRLASHQRDLAGKINLATAAMDKQLAAMKRENAETQRMIAAKARYDKSMALHGKVTQAGKMTLGAGITMGLPIAATVRQYASFEDAMLGVARQVNDARDATGKLTPLYYEMGDAIKAMSERLPLTANEFAAIVEAGARMGIQGKENLLMYAESTAVMATAFQLPVDKIGEDIGKISQLYHIPMKDMKSLGDTLNWLDDNALAKGGDIIDVMQRIAGVADMVKMNFKQAAALGSTFLSLGAAPEVAATASNAMMMRLANAPMLATAKRYRQGLEMLHLKAKDLQLGMNKDSTGTIIKVLEAIKALPEQNRLEAATRLFGVEYGDDAAKLASNLEEYRRQLDLVNQAKAKGSMDREMSARNANLSAGYQEMKNVVSNLAADLGEKLRPELLAVMGAISGALQGVRGWVKEHPDLTAALIKGAAVLALLVTGLGAVVFAIGAILAPIALLRFALSWMGGTTLGAVALRLVSLVGILGRLGMAFSVGYAIGTWVNTLLDKMASSIAGYKTSLGGLIFDIVQMFKTGDWIGIGNMIVRGIEAGLDMLTGGLYSTVKNMAIRLAGAAKEALGIKSPSRVFQSIGAFTMEGLSDGIAALGQSPVRQVIDITKRMTAAGAGLLIGGAAMAMPALDTRPPLAMGGSMNSSAPMQVTIQINAAPGMDETAIAREVARQLRMLEAERAARGRSRMRDKE